MAAPIGTMWPRAIWPKAAPALSPRWKLHQTTLPALSRWWAARGGGGRGGPANAPPRIYRTDDYGQNWKLVNAGLPNSAAHAVREDPENRNLVFAALEAGVFVSFNGGDQWQSLQLNLPAASCRDLAIEQNDLIVATYGRALWAIDDISPLRELAAQSGADDIVERLSLRARAGRAHAVGYLHRYAVERRRGRGGESAGRQRSSIII